MTFNDLSDANKALHLADLAKANRDRCNEVYHPIDDWSPTDWACAMAGECGEACNLVKKLRRQFERFDPDDVTISEATLRLLYAIGCEVADMVIYADLLCQRLGIKLEDAIREKFNTVSEETGSDIRI
jgi:NTP pyrophosphatase (non-canonical NTP hydrolase)